MQLPNGEWKELWNTHETSWVANHVENYGPLDDTYFSWKKFWILPQDTGYLLYARFSQADFESEFQVDFKTLDSSITIPVQLNTRDGSGNAIESLTIPFKVIVTGSSEPSVCIDQEVVLDT
jgi:hypothetical protein